MTGSAADGYNGWSSPKVSVVVPIFNKACYLSQCLDALSSQTLEAIQIICVDDGSSDQSLEIATAHARRDGRICVVSHHRNQGAGAARNTGLARSSAPFVQFTDADDVLPPAALQSLFQLATSDGVPVVRGSLANFDGSLESTWVDPAQVMDDRHRVTVADETKLWVPYFHVCYLFSKAFLAEHQIRYPLLRVGEDPVFLARCLVKAPAISTTSATTYLYRRVPRPRPGFLTVVEFIAHVRSVRQIYVESPFATCWWDGGDSFYQQDIRTLLAQVSLDSAERESVEAMVRELWPQVPVASFF